VLARDEFEALLQDVTIDRLKSCFDPWCGHSASCPRAKSPSCARSSTRRS
jgi:hypothetical protein